jgi:hypothetical protein
LTGRQAKNKPVINRLILLASKLLRLVLNMKNDLPG